MMKPVDGWQRILAVSYSAWAFYLLIASVALPEVIYVEFGVDLNPYVIGWLSVFVAGLGLFGRVIEQTPENRWWRRGVITILTLIVLFFAGPAIAMAKLPGSDTEQPAGTPPTVIVNPTSAGPAYAATAQHLVPLVKVWEGKHPCPDQPALHCSYFDRIASPPLWTVGYGHTETARAGQRLTERQASELLQRDLVTYWTQVRRGFTPETVAFRLTPQRDAAYTSLGYNVGTAGVRQSTATRRLNEGDIAGGCEALTWWNKAGGRVVRGLVNRRAAERALCRIGL